MGDVMTRTEAERIADALIIGLLKGGDPLIYEAARDTIGHVNARSVAIAAMEARDKIVEKLMKGEM